VMVRNYRAPEIFFKLKYDEEGWLIIFWEFLRQKILLIFFS
jgi:hypothetical protein